jgi:hypothetical protein
MLCDVTSERSAVGSTVPRFTSQIDKQPAWLGPQMLIGSIYRSGSAMFAVVSLPYGKVSSVVEHERGAKC